MKIITYVLTALIASAPMLWIEEYIPSKPVWWTVIAVWLLGNLIGYLEGRKERKSEHDE